MPQLAIGVILGGGLLWYVWRKLSDADVQRARADTDESIIHADSQATQDELERKQAREDAEKKDTGLGGW